MPEQNDNNQGSAEVVVIPSYKGDGVMRIGKLVKIVANQEDGQHYVCMQIGHEGQTVRPIYRSYRVSDCDKGFQVLGKKI